MDCFKINHYDDDQLSLMYLHKKVARNIPHHPLASYGLLTDRLPRAKAQDHLSPYQSVKCRNFGW